MESNFLRALRFRHRTAKCLLAQLKALPAYERTLVDGVPIIRNAEGFTVGGDYDDTYTAVQAAMIILADKEREERAEDGSMRARGWR